MLITGSLPASITLRTIAPYILEGTCLLIISICAYLLAVPLVSKIDQLFGNDAKFQENQLAKTSYKMNNPDPSSRQSSLSVLHSPHRTLLNKSSEESILNTEENCTDIVIPVLSQLEEKVFKKCQILSNDSGLVSYNSYRHKLIEETLRKQYGGDYAPGNVILNLIELNTAESATSLILSKKYDASFFDLIKFQEDISNLHNNDEITKHYGYQDTEFLDPLSHFIPRNMRKPSTTETHTETTNSSEISVGLKPSGRPNTPTSFQRINSKRSREASLVKKSPFPTPVHSQAPLNARVSLSQRSRDEKVEPNVLSKDFHISPLKTEQLFRRNDNHDSRVDVVSKTHVDTEEYLNDIEKRGVEEEHRDEKEEKIIENHQILEKSRIGSSLKKIYKRRRGNVRNKITCNNNDTTKNEKKIGDVVKLLKPNKDNILKLSSSKPTIWNN